jgi:glutamine synthetase
MADAASILERIRKDAVPVVDFRFTDLRGRWQHLGFAAAGVNERVLTEGVMFDGSAVAGWRDASQSDLMLIPDLASAVMDPFSAQPTLILICDVAEPGMGTGYERCPRSIARRAEAHLAGGGQADRLMVATEAAFHLFDDVRSEVRANEAFWRVDAEEGPYNAGTRYDLGNAGHRFAPGVPYAVSPADHASDLRAEIATQLQTMGLEVQQHHHDPAPSQSELNLAASPLRTAADRLQIYRYVVHSVASSYGKTATFMPKPMAGLPGAGLEIQQALWQGDRPLFAGRGYGDLSDLCLHFIGGILQHAHALNAFTNPTTNSYRRLAPGSGAPRHLAYAALNRSAAIRLPFAARPQDKRLELRFPDGAANPYLAFAALLMAGLDGIRHKADPGEPMDRNLYDLPPEEVDELPTLCRTLEDALAALERDRAFLTEGEVFADSMLDAYIALRRAEIAAVEQVPHPVEFQLYYSV